MKLKTIIAVAFTSFILFSCSEGKKENLDISRVYYASIEESDIETKVLLDDKKVCWSENDFISVFEGRTSNSKLQFDGEAGDQTGSFSVVSSSASGTSLSANYAYYPYDAQTTISSSGVLTVTIPENQNYSPSSVASNLNPMVAVTSNVSDCNLNFKNAAAILKINLTGSGSVRSIILSGNNGEILAGEATITAAYGEAPVLSMSPGGDTDVLLDCGESGVALNGSTPTPFYFVVPPQIFSNGFTVLVTGTDGRWMEKTATSSKTIARNVIYNMSSFAYDPYTPISSIRNLYTGSDVTIADNVKIKGSVISNFRTSANGGLANYTNAKGLIISDGLSGMYFYLTADNTTLALGDEVSVNLSGATLTSYNGVTQVSDFSIDNITKLGSAPLDPITVTAAGLLSGDYEAMYVSVPNVQVVSTDVGKTFVVSSANTSINFESSAGDNFVVFSSKNSTFGATAVPTGSGTLKGIYMTYGTSPATHEIIITSVSDFAGLTGERFTIGGGGGEIPTWITPDVVKPWMELPAVTMNASRAYVSHPHPDNPSARNYSMLYDKDYCLALWVAYPLCSYYIGDATRSTSWKYDPKIPADYQPCLSSSYPAANYDRGHQLASANRTSSTALNKTTFYYSNATAQEAALNQKIWKNLEDDEREYAAACDTLYVITGPVMTTESDPVITYTLDKNGKSIAVPKAYFKVFLKYTISTNTYSGIGFWYENRAYDYNTPTASDAHTINWIESKTGYTFFNNLPEDIKYTVKNEFAPTSWGL